jgi:alkanesulfonate monooxygenase SsuD/methylene tetrahydromethanopterin reductase-like flavin-dependent oxidoreductase (luciferase family)
MNYGISVPNFGDYFDARAVAQIAKEAEDAGWDGIFFWDHIHGGEWMRAPMADPWMLLTACAMTTSRMKLGPMITPLARRRPHVVARQAVTLDHLSAGRLVLGVGLGYPPDAEFEAFGEDGDDRIRAKKLDEALDILTGLWSGDPFSYDGEHHSVRDVTFLPAPVQQPRIPIWCAAMLPSRAPLRRAVRYDGVVPLRMSEEGMPELLSASDVGSLAAFAKSQRPDGAPFDIVVAGWTPDPAQLRDLAPEREAAGATWWFEDAIAYGDFSTGVSLNGIASLRARIAKGPLG